MTNFARNSVPVLAKIIAKIQKNQKKKNFRKFEISGIAKFRSFSEIMKFC